MRFWPFGKRDDENLEFGSRVVTAKARDGMALRGKISVTFIEPLSKQVAEDLLDKTAAAFVAQLEQGADAAELLAAGEELSLAVTESVASAAVRSIEVAALHALGELPESAARSTHPSSRPPSRAPMPSRRSTSSQMLAVRDSRLIPEGAPAEVVGDSLVPLLKDASTRLLVAALRAYDLCVIRQLPIDGADEFGELVPQSTAAPGHFAENRAEEVARWEESLGAEKVATLSFEASVVASYFLHVNLSGSGLAPALATRILERAVGSAFPDDPPLGGIAAYLAGTLENTRERFAQSLIEILGAHGKGDLSDKFTMVLGATHLSLQSDFAFVAHQVALSGVKPGD